MSKIYVLPLCIALADNNDIELDFEIILNEYLIPRLSYYIPALLNKSIWLKKTGSPQKESVWSINIDKLPPTGNLVRINCSKTILLKYLKNHFKSNLIDKWFEDKFFISNENTNLAKKPLFTLKKEKHILVLNNSEKANNLRKIIKDEVLKNILIYFWKYDVKKYLKEFTPLEEFCKSPKLNESVFGIFKIAKNENAFHFKINSDNLRINLIETDSTRRIILLNEISKSFNKIFSKSWKTYFGKKIKLIIYYEGTNLCFRFDDGRPSPPEYRSDGVKWFLTFLINFQSKQKDLSNYILIMDEPGGFLHPRGQKDVLKFLLKLANKNQIFYSTHQPFLIDKNNSQNVRILDRKLKESKLDFWPSKIYNIKNRYKHILRDSLLRESLGFTLSDISPINENNVLVEGTFDRNILHFYNKKYKILDMNNLSIINCGGASNIKFHAEQYINSDLKILCIYDHDHEGKQYFENNTDVKKEQKLYISSKDGESIEDILPENVFKDSFTKLKGLSEYNRYFKNQNVTFEKPYIKKTFKVHLKQDTLKSMRTLIKHKLEDLMLYQIETTFQDSEYKNIKNLLHKIKTTF